MSQLPLIPSSQEKAEMNSPVFEIDPVFVYRIEDKLKNPLKALEWDTANPVWDGKLQIVEVPATASRCQIQFVNNNSIFGVVANKDPMFQKVLDSSRYFTAEIENTNSGKNEVIGIGFINRCDGSKLFKAVEQYFASKDSINNDEPAKCNRNDSIIVEINEGIPENSNVQDNNLQECKSDKSTIIQCQKDSILHTTDATTDIIQKHFETSTKQNANRDTDLGCLDLNSIAAATTDSSMNCNINDPVVVKTSAKIPEKSQVEVNTLQESRSDIQSPKGSSLRSYTTADIFKNKETSNEQNVEKNTSSTAGATNDIPTECNENNPVTVKTTIKIKVPEKSPVKVNTSSESQIGNATLTRRLSGGGLRTYTAADIFKKHFETSNEQNSDAQTNLQCQKLNNTVSAASNKSIECNKNDPIVVKTSAKIADKSQDEVNTSQESPSVNATYIQGPKSSSLRSYTTADLFKTKFETSNETNAERNTLLDCQELSSTAGATTDVPTQCNENNPVTVKTTIKIKVPEKSPVKVNTSPQTQIGNATLTQCLSDSSLRRYTAEDIFKKHIETSNEKNAAKTTHYLDCQKLSSTAGATTDMSLKCNQKDPVIVKNAITVPEKSQFKVNTLQESPTGDATYTRFLKDSSLRTYTAADIFTKHFESSNEQISDTQTNLNCQELNNTEIPEKSKVEVNTLKQPQIGNSTYIRCLNISSLLSKTQADIVENKFETSNKKIVKRNTHLVCQQRSSTASVTTDEPIKCNKKNPVTVQATINIKVPEKRQVEENTLPESQIGNSTYARCLKGKSHCSYNAADIFKNCFKTRKEQNSDRKTDLDCLKVNSPDTATTHVSMKCNEKDQVRVKSTNTVRKKSSVEVNTAQESESDKTTNIQSHKESSLRTYKTDDISKKHFETSNETISEIKTKIDCPKLKSPAGSTTDAPITCNKKNPDTVKTKNKIKVPEKSQVEVNNSPESQIGTATLTRRLSGSSLCTYTASDNIFKKHCETSNEASAERNTLLDCQVLGSTCDVAKDVPTKCNKNSPVTVKTTINIKLPEKSQAEVNNSPESLTGNATLTQCLSGSSLRTYTAADIFKKHIESSNKNNPDTKTTLNCQELNNTVGVASNESMKCNKNDPVVAKTSAKVAEKSQDKVNTLQEFKSVNTAHTRGFKGSSLRSFTAADLFKKQIESINTINEKIAAKTTRFPNFQKLSSIAGAAINVSMKCNKKDPVILETTFKVPDKSKVKINPSQVSQSVNATHMRCLQESSLRSYTTSDIFKKKFETSNKTNAGTTTDATVCTTKEPEESQVDVSTSPGFQSDKASHIQCHILKRPNLDLETSNEQNANTEATNLDRLELNSTIGGVSAKSLPVPQHALSSIPSRDEATTIAVGKYKNDITDSIQVRGDGDTLAHTRKRQVEIVETIHDEHNNVKQRILNSANEPKSKTTLEKEITIENDSEKEGHCTIAKKRKIELQSQVQSNPAQNDIQIPKPSEQCGSGPSSEDVLSENKNGASYFDPVTREWSCHLCGFKTDSKSDMKLLLSHWKKDHALKEPNTCNICYLIFLTPEQLLKHTNALHNTVCTICSLQFSNQRAHNRHLTRVHREEGRRAGRPGEDNGGEGQRLASSGDGGDKPEEGEITIDSGSEDEGSCRTSKKWKFELKLEDQNKSKTNRPLNIEVPPEQNVGQEPVLGFNAADQKPPRPYVHVPSFLPSLELSGSEDGTLCLHPVTLQLICPLCGFKTYSKSDMKLLLSHWRKDHDMTSPNTCSICYIIFSTPEQRLSHLKSHAFVCFICTLEFKSEKNLLGHIKKLHIKIDSWMSPPDIDNNHHTCNRCSKEFEITKDLIDHFKLATSSSTTQCSATTTTIVQKYENGINYSLEVGKKNQFVCHLCPNAKFCSLKLIVLLHHWEIKHDLKEPNTCTICHLIFSTAEQRLNHSKALHKVCNICSLEFGKQKLHNLHMEIFHSVNGITKQRKVKKAATTPNDRALTTVRTLSGSAKNKREKATVKIEVITILDSDSEEEVPSCSTPKKKNRTETHQSQDQNKLGSGSNPTQILDSPPVQKDSSESVENPSGSGQCAPRLLPSEGLLSDNEKRTSYLDPVTLELICPLCSFKTHSKSDMLLLLSHWRKDHDMTSPNTCNLCHILFSTPEERLSHKNFHHFICSVCSLEFTEQNHLLSHIEIWHLKKGLCISSNNNKRYRCTRCSKEFENINAWMDHFRPTTQQSVLSSVTSTSEESTTTPTTTTATVQKFKNGIDYSLHVGGKTQFVCHLCPTEKLGSLKTLSKLLDHWARVHDLRDPITCGLCNRIFSTPGQRLNHSKALHKVCSICSKEFGKEKIHNRHMYKVHKIQP